MATLDTVRPSLSWGEEEDVLGEIGFSLKRNAFSDFFMIITAYQHDKPQTRTNARKLISEFETEEKNYFQLFKPSQYEISKGDTATKAFERDMKNLKDFSYFPTLREIYAASEFLQRTIALITLEKGTMRFCGIQVRPLLHEFEDNIINMVIVLKFVEGGVYFQQVNWPENRSLESSPFTILNKDHEQCFDRRFCNSYDVLKNDFCFNPMCGDVVKGNDEECTIFEVVNAVVYKDSASNYFVKDIMKMHQADQFNLELYTSLIENRLDLYLTEEEIKCANDEKDSKKKQIQEKQNRLKAQKIHLKEWRVLSEGDIFAVASLYHIEVFVKK